MIESSRIADDSFATNDQSNDVTANVASFIADAGVNSFGGSLVHSSYVTSSVNSVLSISDYLSRPKLMYSGTITDYITTPGIYDFAYDYLNSSDVKEKLKYIHLLRGTFQLKLVVTSGPYNTGRLAMSSMYGTQGEYGALPLDTPLLVANLQSKTNVMLDLGSTNTATLSIPLHQRFPHVQNSKPDVDELKKMKLYFYTVNTIRNSNALASSIVYWKIYVSFVQADTVIPVPIVGDYEPTSEVAQTANGVISAPASVVSSIAHGLKDVPIIGPFALATSIGASAISSIARLFGFSRPRDQSKPMFPHSVNLSSGIGEVRSKNLTIDPKQETTIDNSFLGESGDSLSYQNTICRKGIVNIFSWTQLQTPGTIIKEIPISPMYCPSIVSSTIRYFSPTPLAYCSQLFTGWRGSIDVHISVPANKFVRGKVRVYWNPYIDAPAPSLSLLSNNSLSALIDLTQTIDMTITVPWMSNNMYKEVGEFFDSNPSDDNLNKWSNGFLVFVVEEPLVSNNSSWEADFIVYYSAGNDFELVYPSNQGISYVNFGLIDPTKTYVFPIVQNTPITRQTGVLTPLLNDWQEHTSESNNVNPAMTTSINLNPGDSNDKAAIIHIGESIPSLRLLCKRFYPLYNFTNSNVTAQVIHGIFCQYFPQVPIGQVLSGSLVFPANNNPITYLSKMFAGVRGSTRYFVSSAATRDVFVARMYGTPNALYQITDSSSSAITLNTIITGGIAFYKSQGEPTVFDIPYQNYHWFYPTAHRLFDSAATEYGATMFTSPGAGTTTLPQTQYFSTGEDFQFVIYNGPPIVCKYNPVP